MVIKWFYLLSHQKIFVGGKYALPSALLVAVVKDYIRDCCQHCCNYGEVIPTEHDFVETWNRKEHTIVLSDCQKNTIACKKINIIKSDL